MIVDFDVETTGLQWPYHDAFMYQFGDEQGNVEVLRPGVDDRRIQEWFDIASRPGNYIRAWNGRFDRHFGESGGYTLPGDGKWRDGMLGAHAIDERRSIALKAVGDSLGFSEGAEYQKAVKQWLTDERKRRAKIAKDTGTELIEPNYSDVPDHLMVPYAIEDIHLTRKVCAHQDPIIEATPDLKSIVEFEHQVFDALYAVERRGIPVDREAYAKLEIEVIENLERMEEFIDELAAVGLEEGDEFEFNPRSSKQIYAALKRRGADLRFVTGESMDAENLETVDDVLAAKILDFRSEFKVLSTYVRPYIGRSYDTSIRSWKEPFIANDGRIHAGYRQVGARTGRMSCSDPNIQNQPRDDLRLRYNFRAEPGFKLVSCDLNSVEMAVLGGYAGPGRLLDAIKNGEDMHTLTADFVGLRERKRPNGIIESRRQRGKTFNFAVMYGLGIRGTRKKFQVSMDQARQMHRRYKDAYPEVERLQNMIEWRLEDRGYVSSAWGRRFRGDRRDAYKFLNYLIQGTSADIFKQALIELHKDGVPVVGLVHDEVLAHVPEEDAEEVKELIIKRLTDHPRITEKVPLTADGDIIDRWSEAKNPDFKPKWAEAA